VTLANLITIIRLVLIPIFGVLAWAYGQSVLSNSPNEIYRWGALCVFIFVASGDALDGYVARRMNTHTKLGAILDPLTDKVLMLVALIVLSQVPWGEHGWQLPTWFAAMVVLRDLSIGLGITMIMKLNGRVAIHTHWIGKVSTTAQMITLGWVMLKVVPFSPLYPTLVTAAITLFSAYHYTLESIKQLHSEACPPNDNMSTSPH